jgi:hypothetical protein
VGGEDPIQGHAESIRGTSTSGRGRPWLASAMGGRRGLPCLARHGIDREEEKVRGKGADRRVPRGSEGRGG